MVQTFPLALPGTLVDTHRIDLTKLYSQGWGVGTDDVVAAPNGDVYALYRVHRYTWEVAEDEQDPSRANFGYRIITRYSADGEVLASALCRSSYLDKTASAVLDGDDINLCVLPDSTLSVNARPDRTTLIAPDLSRVLAAYDSNDHRPFEEFTPGNGFAGSISVTPSGRLLCSVSEYGVWGYGSSLANVVGFTDGALTPGSRPVIEAIASLDPEPAHQSDDDLKSYVHHQGRPVGQDHRPRPALTEPVADEDRLSRWRDSRLGRPVPLADDLFVVPVFAKIFRSGNRGQPFLFALVNDQGEMTGRLHGLHTYRDSPFTGFCFTLASDPRRGRVFHLNRYGLYAWNKAGVLCARLDTAAKPFKPLVHFTLTACSPDGDLLLVHRKQHLILRVPAPDDLSDLAAAVENALRAYARQRTALKKAWTPVNWHWVDTSAPVHRL